MKKFWSGLGRVVSSPPTWIFVVAFVLCSVPVYASTGGSVDLLSAPIEKLYDLFTGKIARWVGAMLIVVVGMSIAFSQRENKGKAFALTVAGVAVMTGSLPLMTQLGIAGATF